MYRIQSIHALVRVPSDSVKVPKANDPSVFISVLFVSLILGANVKLVGTLRWPIACSPYPYNIRIVHGVPGPMVTIHHSVHKTPMSKIGLNIQPPTVQVFSLPDTRGGYLRDTVR